MNTIPIIKTFHDVKGLVIMNFIGWSRKDRRQGGSTHSKIRRKDILSVCRIDDDIGFVLTMLVVLLDTLVHPGTSIQV